MLTKPHFATDLMISISDLRGREMEARTSRISEPATDIAFVRSVLRYDRELRRLWIRGQRMHHGLTGVFLAALGGVLMAHDWKDRRAWFRRGPQD